MSLQSENKAGRMINFIWIGLIFSLFYWIIESVRDVIAFDKGTLMDRLFTPDRASLWMRVLVICMIMFFSGVVQSLRQKAESRQIGLDVLGKRTILIISLVFGVFYWVIESVRDVVIYHRGTLVQQIFAPDPLAFWMRFLAILFLILFGLYMKTLIEERRKAEEGLKQLKETHFKDFERKLAALEAEKENLNKELKSKGWEEQEVRELLRQKESFLRSVHQVVKTNLQYLNSLFDIRIISSDQEYEKKQYTEIRTLVHSLILLHTYLNKSDHFNHVILSDFLQGVIDYLYHSHQIQEVKVHADSAHILIPVSQAVPFVFMICEIFFLANKKRKLGEQDVYFQILIKRTEDEALSIKIRHRDQEILPGIENEEISTEYQWIRELIDQQLRGDFWVLRNAQGIDINIAFKLKM